MEAIWTLDQWVMGSNPTSVLFFYNQTLLIKRFIIKLKLNFLKRSSGLVEAIWILDQWVMGSNPNTVLFCDK